MKLTDVFLRNLKPTDKVQKYSDGDGLHIHVTVQGSKLWRMNYRFDGKQKTLSFGKYPYVSLKDARGLRHEARSLLAKGIDPSAQKKAVKAAARAEITDGFEVVAREWFDRNKAKWVPRYRGKIISRLENDIFPFIGGKNVRDITAADLLDALRCIESRGAIETAHRALQVCGQIFRYAVQTDRAGHNIAADLKGALTPAIRKHHPTIINPFEIGQLLRAIDTYWGNPIVTYALKLIPLVYVRHGELREAVWSEFNFDDAEWRIPAEKMKMSQPHIIPLSRQAMSIISELKVHHERFAIKTDLLFPGDKDDSKPISDGTLNRALKSLGYKGKMTVHGFRSMFSTTLNEKKLEWGFDADTIERQLAHSEKNSVRAAYN